MRLKKAVPRAFTAAVTAVVAGLGIGTIAPAQAGPVERELIARGDDVGTPKQRPSRNTAISPNNSTTANPLDAPEAGGTTKSPTNLTRKKVASSKSSAQVELVTTPELASTGPSACLQALRQIAHAEAVATPDANDSACVIEDPVVLIRTKSLFPIEYARNLTLDCPFALALAKFSDGTGQALARHHIGSAISKIHSGEGFVCRRRNNRPTGKLSEHAFGNATDWVGFTFADGSRLPIKDTSELDLDEAGFLNNVRTAACGAFTTVLGPGSNAAHSSHFHFDLGRSKDRKNPYRICE